MSVSLTNFAQLKQRVSRQTRHRDEEFNAFFPQWLNEIIYRVESGNTPLQHTFDDDVEVAVTAGTYDIDINKLIPFHDFSIKRELDDGSFSEKLRKLDPSAVGSRPRREEDRGETNAYSLISKGSGRTARILLFPAPEEDITLHISGYFYSVRSTWADTDTTYLIENEPLLMVYGISALVYEHFNELALSERARKMYQREFYGNEAEHGVDGLMLRQQMSDVPEGGRKFESSFSMDLGSYADAGERTRSGELRRVTVVSPIKSSVPPVPIFENSGALNAYVPPAGEGWLAYDKGGGQLYMWYRASESLPMAWHSI